MKKSLLLIVLLAATTTVVLAQTRPGVRKPVPRGTGPVKPKATPKPTPGAKEAPKLPPGYAPIVTPRAGDREDAPG